MWTLFVSAVWALSERHFRALSERHYQALSERHYRALSEGQFWDLSKRRLSTVWAPLPSAIWALSKRQSGIVVVTSDNMSGERDENEKVQNSTPLRLMLCQIQINAYKISQNLKHGQFTFKCYFPWCTNSKWPLTHTIILTLLSLLRAICAPLAKRCSSAIRKLQSPLSAIWAPHININTIICGEKRFVLTTNWSQFRRNVCERSLI